MDGDNSKAKSSRNWGTTDLEEDVDAYNAYQIPKDKIDNISSSKTVGYNKTNEILNTVTEKKKKSKGKGKQTTVTTSDETKRQLSHSFDCNPDDLNGNVNKLNQGSAAIQLPKHKPNEDSLNKVSEIENISSNFSTTFYQPNSIPNRPVLQHRPTNEINPNLYSYGFNSRGNPAYPLNYPNILFQPRIYPQANPMFSVTNLPNFNIGNPVPRMINYQPQNNVTKASYYERLEVIDVLFRFIIQILRTPEQPSFEQIEDIKKMLDSLIKNNDANLT